MAQKTADTKMVMEDPVLTASSVSSDSERDMEPAADPEVEAILDVEGADLDADAEEVLVAEADADDTDVEVDVGVVEADLEGEGVLGDAAPRHANLDIIVPAGHLHLPVVRSQVEGEGQAPLTNPAQERSVMLPFPEGTAGFFVKS